MQVKVLNFLSRPGSFAKKRETRLHAGIRLKASYVNHVTKLLPSVEINHFSENGLKRLSVEGVLGYDGFFIIHRFCS